MDHLKQLTAYRMLILYQKSPKSAMPMVFPLLAAEVTCIDIG